MIDLALLRTARRCNHERVGGGWVLQVHDLLGRMAPVKTADKTAEIVQEEMQRPVHIPDAVGPKKWWSFPVKVEVRDRWEPIREKVA